MVLIVVAVHKGLVEVDKSLSVTHDSRDIADIEFLWWGGVVVSTISIIIGQETRKIQSQEIKV